MYRRESRNPSPLGFSFPYLPALLGALWCCCSSLTLADTAPVDTPPLHVIQDESWAPLSFRDQDGEPRGLLIDLWRAIGEAMGRDVVFELHGSSQGITEVRGNPGKVHGGTLLSARLGEHLDFSKPLMPLHTVLFVANRGALSDARDISDLVGHTVGIVAGGFEVTYMRGQYPGINLRTYDNHELLIRAAVRGDVQAFVVDQPVGEYFLNRFTSPRHFRVLTPLYQRPLAAGIVKGNTALLAEINKALEQIPPERHAEIVRRWTGKDSGQLVPRGFLTALGGLLGLLLITGLLLHVRSIHKQLQLQNTQLGDQQKQIDLLARNMNDYAWIVSADGLLSYVSPSVSNVLGYTPEELIGREMTATLGPDAAARAYSMQAALVAAAKRGEYEGHAELTVEIAQQHKEGDVIWTDATMQVFFTPEGEFAGAQGVSRDVTERHKAEEAMRRLAFNDPLTHLPNRRMLTDRVVRMIAACERHRQYSALLFLDLDNFKYFNDHQGHEGGDRLLVLAAQRLSHNFTECDTVARFEGDEFVILTSLLGADKAEAQAEARRIGERILALFSKPFSIFGEEHVITASVGIILLHDGKRGVHAWLKSADVAMYTAKSLGRNKLFMAE